MILNQFGRDYSCGGEFGDCNSHTCNNYLNSESSSLNNLIKYINDKRSKYPNNFDIGINLCETVREDSEFENEYVVTFPVMIESYIIQLFNINESTDYRKLNKIIRKIYNPSFVDYDFNIIYLEEFIQQDDIELYNYIKKIINIKLVSNN